LSSAKLPALFERKPGDHHRWAHHRYLHHEEVVSMALWMVIFAEELSVSGEASAKRTQVQAMLQSQPVLRYLGVGDFEPLK
jgi:hypothetical protein